jgi:hypothetical protein
VDLDLVPKEDTQQARLYGVTANFVIRTKGVAEMANARPRYHELAATAVRLSKQGFPRGLSEGSVTDKPTGRVLHPHQRVGWMADLLPMLGYDDVYRQIKKDEGWRSQDNLQAGAYWVAPFLDPSYPRGSFVVTPPGLAGRSLGATHFVGMAGVGPDAATYPATDPRAGIFGYNRQTKLEDITDGASNTIYLIQVPPAPGRGWIMGGGATMQGVPEKDSVKPFVHTRADGKRGTVVMMADGSVRFISADISDEAFKKLCTTHAGETSDDLDTIAPKLPAAGEATAPARAGAAPKP